MSPILLGLLAFGPNIAAEPAPPTLAELASRADLVAIAQLVHTEYRPREGTPEAGFALLRLLIPYKRPDSQDVVAVYAERGQPAACFYPVEPDADERYLVFLRRRGDGQCEARSALLPPARPRRRRRWGICFALAARGSSCRPRSPASRSSSPTGPPIWIPPDSRPRRWRTRLHAGLPRCCRMAASASPRASA